MAAKARWTQKSVLALSQQERVESVAVFQARRLGLVVVDGVGQEAQFIGTQKEFDARMDGMRGCHAPGTQARFR